MQSGQGAAPAQPRRATRPFQLSVAVEETYTDNVGLDPSNIRRSDLVTRITPTLSMYYAGAHSLLQGSLSAPALLYARSGSRNNRVVPEVDVTGRVDTFERRLFLEAAAHVAQSYFSPFGATSTAIENNPSNAYTSHSYRLTPYFTHSSGDYAYEVRDNNLWTNLSSTPVSVGNAYTNDLLATFTRAARPLGFALDYRRTDLQFADQPSQLTELGRLRLTARPDPDVQVFASGGYENERYPFANHQGFIYGVGGQWRPSDRTRLDASWEHRFFGASYHVRFENRTPLTVWSLGADRDITSYPQALATLGAGDVASILDQLFAGRVPDAAERAQLVQQFIQERGLPATLSDAVSIFSRRVQLEQRINATVGLLGARNSVFLRVYRARTEPVSESEFTDVLEALNNNATQVGGSATWTHSLAPRVRLLASAEHRYVTSNGSASASSRETAIYTALSLLLGPNTTARGGVRVQRLRSDIAPGYDEAAVFIGVAHVFR